MCACEGKGIVLYISLSEVRSGILLTVYIYPIPELGSSLSADFKENYHDAKFGGYFLFLPEGTEKML